MVKPGVSISPGLGSVPGRDRQTKLRWLVCAKHYVLSRVKSRVYITGYSADCKPISSFQSVQSVQTDQFIPCRSPRLLGCCCRKPVPRVTPRRRSDAHWLARPVTSSPLQYGGTSGRRCWPLSGSTGRCTGRGRVTPAKTE